MPSRFCFAMQEQDLPAKQSGKRAGAFRALNPQEVCSEKNSVSKQPKHIQAFLLSFLFRHCVNVRWNPYIFVLNLLERKHV